MPGDKHRAETLHALRQLCGTAGRAALSESTPRQSLGIEALDALLPGGGLEAGSLVEWLVPTAGSGAAIVALQGVRWAVEQQLVWAVVDATGDFHPPAACGWGISLQSLLLLRPASMADAVWTVEQCLRCPAVGVTWFSSESIPDRSIADRIVQRWKRAVEVGGGMGVLFRPLAAGRRSSWADVRWQVRPEPRAGTAERVVTVELISCRGHFTGGVVKLELHDATGDVRLVSAVARPTTAVCGARV